MNNRRAFLTSVAIGTAWTANSSMLQASELGQQRWPNSGDLSEDILEPFRDLPGRKAVKIWSPATGGGQDFSAQINQHRRMFTASTNKSYILCERLRQLDSPIVAERIAKHDLNLDKDIYSPGSPILNPPNLAGIISERTAMEAMVVHSDNTGTDMVLREAGVVNVRKFIASIGLKNTIVPDSTRAFAAYLVGASNYLTITWDELAAIPPGPLAHPFLNDVETLASSPADLVSLFSRSLQGKFFTHRETLEEFRRILALGDINYLVRFPLGISAFGKAGYADVSGAHARSIAGGLYFNNRWVYFSFILNWDAQEEDDSRTVEAFYSAVRRAARLLQERYGN
jgi:beta-lactamase class A